MGTGKSPAAKAGGGKGANTASSNANKVLQGEQVKYKVGSVVKFNGTDLYVTSAPVAWSNTSATTGVTSAGIDFEGLRISGGTVREYRYRARFVNDGAGLTSYLGNELNKFKPTKTTQKSGAKTIYTVKGAKMVKNGSSYSFV